MDYYHRFRFSKSLEFPSSHVALSWHLKSGMTKTGDDLVLAVGLGEPQHPMIHHSHLVGGCNPSEKYWVRQLGLLFPTEWKTKCSSSSHHQAVINSLTQLEDFESRHESLTETCGFWKLNSELQVPEFSSLRFCITNFIACS